MLIEFTESGTNEKKVTGRQPNAKEKQTICQGDPRFPNGTNRVLGRKGFFPRLAGLKEFKPRVWLAVRGHDGWLLWALEGPLGQ